MASDNDQSTMEKKSLQSWDRTEQFYKSQDSHAWPNAQILTLIAELRQRGYDRHLLSQSRPELFILSPTGLSHHDAKLMIYIKKNGVMVLHYHDGAKVEIQTEVDHAEFTAELESLLERLVAHPID